MSKIPITPRKFIGASTDTKPSGVEVPIGSTFFEHDTQAMHITYNDGTNWVLKEPFGEVKAGPTSNTVLDRLKSLLTGIVLAAGSNAIGDVGIERVSLANVTATIDNAASLSDEIDLGGSSFQTLIMSAAWTAASISFQVAEASGGTWGNLYDDSGAEVLMTVAAARVVPLPAELAGVRFVKIRSGTAGTPVVQNAERVLTVILKG